MNALPILLLLLSLMACGGLVTLLAKRATRQPVLSAGDVLRRVARRTAVLRGAGVAVGMIVGIIAGQSGGLGTGLLLAAPLFGLCTLIGVLVGELTVRPPRGPTRTAAVEVRRIRHYLPRRLSRAVVGAVGILLVLAAATTAAGIPDDAGRRGRSLGRQCTPDIFESHGPWPGLFYTAQLMAVVLIGLLMAAIAIRAVVRRPRSGCTADVAVDDALRKRAARAVTGALGILITIPLGGVSITAAGGLLGISCAPMWWKVLGWGLLALVPASLAMMSWCAAAVFTPMDQADLLLRTQ